MIAAIVVLALLLVVLFKRQPRTADQQVPQNAVLLAYPQRLGGWKQVQRSLPDMPAGAEDLARRIVRELSVPETDPALFPPLPETFPLRSVYLDGTRLYLDVSPEALLELSGGSEEEIIAIESIKRTLSWNLPALDRLQFLVDGQPRRTLGAAGEDAGHLAIFQPILLKK